MATATTQACSFLCLVVTPGTISLSSSPFVSLKKSRRPSPLHIGFTTTTTTRHPLLLQSNDTTTARRPSISPASASASASVPDAIIPEQDTATSSIISALLFIAFVGLSILTIGVVYIAVTDFLQKREGEKFQKEEAEKKKKGGGKKRQSMKARRAAGPKGFGQKVVQIEDDDDI